jgi:hypothetical protein
VALAVLLSAESYRRLLDAFDPRAIDPAQVIPPKEAVRASVWEAFGPLDRVGKTASQCWADVEAKLDAWGAAVEHWSEMLAGWDDVRSGIRTLLRPPEFLASILRAVDAPAVHDWGCAALLWMGSRDAVARGVGALPEAG